MQRVVDLCQAPACKANMVLDHIHRGINNKIKEVVLKVYRNLVRPHLEYWTVFRFGHNI